MTVYAPSRGVAFKVPHLPDQFRDGVVGNVKGFDVVPSSVLTDQDGVALSPVVNVYMQVGSFTDNLLCIHYALAESGDSGSVLDRLDIVCPDYAEQCLEPLNYFHVVNSLLIQIFL
nr:hypothetical protein [uncultured Pseudodesulfovibrio sp.]